MERYTGEKADHKDENVGSQSEGYQGMDEKRAKETDDGRKEEKDRKRKK